LIAHQTVYCKEHQLENYAFFDQKSSRNSSKLVPDYFEKFIKDIAKKVDISATGFEVITQTAVRSATYNWCMIF
jgi:hypothetical protein